MGRKRCSMGGLREKLPIPWWARVFCPDAQSRPGWEDPFRCVFSVFSPGVDGSNPPDRPWRECLRSRDESTGLVVTWLLAMTIGSDEEVFWRRGEGLV